MANGIKPSGYFTTDPSIGGGSGAMRELLDPMDPAGAYRAFLNSRLFPSDVGDYSNITSSGAFGTGPFSLIPTGEGLVTGVAGAVNPFAGLLARGAISGRNAEALETLANQGILQVINPAEPSSGFRKFLGYEYTPGTGQYRLSPETEKAILATGSTPEEYFESQFKSQYGQANELAKYLDQVAYTTQGEFFTTDLFGNPTPWSKYVDRQGNILPDALANWQKFGQKDKMGVLAPFFDNDDDNNQGTQAGFSNQGSSGGGGYIGAPFESQQTGGGGIADLPKKGTGSEGPGGRYTPKSPKKGTGSEGPGGRYTSKTKTPKKGTGSTGPGGRYA